MLTAPGTVVGALSAHARAQPDKAALVFEGRSTSFAELDDRTDRVACALVSCGIARGERVAYLGRNTDAFFALLYGAMKAGIVLVPINWRLAPPEVFAIVADCGARMLLLGREYVGQAEYAAVPGVDHLFSAEQCIAAWQGTQSSAEPPTPATDDIALQLYTSGTTGKPKGVMLSHRNLTYANVAGQQIDLGWNRWAAQDAALLAMPVAHIAGRVGASVRRCMAPRATSSASSIWKPRSIR